MSKAQTMPLEIWTDINGNAARTQFKGGTKYIRADAQATVEALQRERDEWKASCNLVEGVLKRDDLQAALDAEREKVKGLHEVTKVICAHCCEPMEIPSKAVLQTQLSQLQALVRAVSDTMEPFRKSMAKLDEVDTLATRRIAEADAYYCAQRVLAALGATTPAAKGGDGE